MTLNNRNKYYYKVKKKISLILIKYKQETIGR